MSNSIFDHTGTAIGRDTSNGKGPWGLIVNYDEHNNARLVAVQGFDDGDPPQEVAVSEDVLIHASTVEDLLSVPRPQPMAEVGDDGTLLVEHDTDGNAQIVLSHDGKAVVLNDDSQIAVGLIKQLLTPAS